MANPWRGEVELRAGETVYTLVMDANALCAAQERTKQNPRAMAQAILTDPEDTLLLRALLWGCLQKHHACHVVEAGEILTEAGEAGAASAVIFLVMQAFPMKAQGDDMEDKEGENPPKNGNGTDSSGDGAKQEGSPQSSGAKRPKR